MYALKDYDYHLPEALIAQSPKAQRSESRLLRVQRRESTLDHLRFTDISRCLQPGDVLVLNNTRVIPGRLLGHKESGGKIEALVLDYAQGVKTGRFECMVRASKRPKAGTRLIFDQGLEARVLEVLPTTCTLEFQGPVPFEEALETVGHMPLPPYIQRGDTPEDRSTYQTVYARNKGAIAAPTAGLHFSTQLLDRLARRGVQMVYLTLHVGYGTFVPVRVDDIRDHRMHAEWFTLTRDAAETINKAKSAGGRVVAVGTTSVRTLEYCAGENDELTAQTGMCDLFIYPGYTFKTVDGMITNFHLPQSTLLMLVSAFAGRERTLAAYAEAVKQEYRFYSYGDAMLIV